MLITQTAGQVLVAGFSGLEPPARLLRDISNGGLAGIIVFGRNIDSIEQVLRLTREVLQSKPPDGTQPLISVDQEGGRVARLRAPVIKLPPMRALAAIDDPTLTERAAEALGAQLRALGFNLDFAPVLDVDTNPDNPVIGDRAFGNHADIVIRHGLAFARGLKSAGILSCGKHFPGHGDTDVDSHLTLPRLSHSLERLRRVELAPFRAAATELPAIMTAHVVFEAIDADLPATLSKAVVTGVLREELGFEGVIVSDDLEMNAVSEGWGVAEAGILAIEAGCDLLLVCSDLDACASVRDALAREAETSASFRTRLQDAALRVQRARKSALRATGPRFEEIDVAAIEDDIARAISRS